MDDIDMQLLFAMEKNSRLSLKNLATELHIKPSTAYERLHKLKQQKILDKFTICINPEKIGFNYHILLTIQMKISVIGKFDTKFIESYIKLLSDEYPDIMFSSIGEDGKIWSIATFKDEAAFLNFETILKKNSFIESYSITRLTKIVKGTKIFTLFQKKIQPLKKTPIHGFTDHKSEDHEKKDNKKDAEDIFF